MFKAGDLVQLVDIHPYDAHYFQLEDCRGWVWEVKQCDAVEDGDDWLYLYGVPQPGLEERCGEKLRVFRAAKFIPYIPQPLLPKGNRVIDLGE